MLFPERPVADSPRSAVRYRRHWDRLVMSMRPQTYTERAHHCEQMAFRVRDAEAKSKFVQLARQWHARAAQEGENRPSEAVAAARR